ncbi:guanosine nucleotide diphosphate dissociation inhibitor 1, partial [Tanacetum coccineum]
VKFDEENTVCGVTSDGETAKCKKVVCDPSYLSNKLVYLLLVVSWPHKAMETLCVMNNPIFRKKIGQEYDDVEAQNQQPLQHLLKDADDVFEAYFVLCARNVRQRCPIDLPWTMTFADFCSEETTKCEVFRKYTDLCTMGVTTRRAINPSASPC